MRSMKRDYDEEEGGKKVMMRRQAGQGCSAECVKTTVPFPFSPTLKGQEG